VPKKPNRKKPSPLANLPEKSRYVSRGGDKLRGALDVFGVSVKGKICLDIGSSTGGFTDCLLQADAKSVWAVDVGYGLIDYKLRKDPRVHLLERTNFRHMDLALITETPELAVVDVSFISLDRIFPKILKVLAKDGEIVALVKPQFEGTPKEVPGGFVKDEDTRQMILHRVKTMAQAASLKILAMADSDIKGRKGNQESFLHLKMSNA
jgi:23S rRNA (cytidine1920-2'-O)/16S rRNA (cytidine1409-2'-O)-methyltransferase